MKAWNNGQLRELSAEEIAVVNSERKAWNDTSNDRKLLQIKEIRNQKLQETDFYALSDVTLSTEMSNYRQTLRNIPQDYTTNEYDLLLARETDKTKDNFGKLTHTVWEKP